MKKVCSVHSDGSNCRAICARSLRSHETAASWYAYDCSAFTNGRTSARRMTLTSADRPPGNQGQIMTISRVHL
jgi:hypothetical protein